MSPHPSPIKAQFGRGADGRWHFENPRAHGNDVAGKLKEWIWNDAANDISGLPQEVSTAASNDLKAIESGIKHAFRSGVDALPGNSFSIESFMHERPALAQAVSLSPTLKTALAEQVPWSDKLAVNYKWQSDFTDFNLSNFSINMLKGWDNQKLIETFAHEMYHAKHQDLDRLFGSSPIADAAAYRDIKMNQEAGAFLQEYKVHEELKNHFKDSKPVVFEYIDEAGKVEQKPISELIVNDDDQASERNIVNFLLSHDAPQIQEDGSYKRDPDVNLVRNSYKSLYEGVRYQGLFGDLQQ